MKILHLAAENVTGTIEKFVRGHHHLGHKSRFVTFFPGASQYAEDICLDLPFVGPMNWLKAVKEKTKFSSTRVPITGNGEAITWQPGKLENILFNMREAVWKPKINKAAEKYGLWNYDIYHLEGGISFYRDGSDIRELKRNGKKIVSNYHGLDLRVRGAIPAIWELSDLNFTCEFDLYQMYPELKYLFLPFDTDGVPQAAPSGEKVRICHAPRSRVIKGTELIVKAVEDLQREIPLELVLIENMTHEEALTIKASCHLAIDQVARGAMGYGVNSLESLSMGIPTITYLSDEYQDFIPDHPFILTNPDKLKKSIKEAVLDEDKRNSFSKKGKDWVVKKHDWRSVARFIHDEYAARGWTN